MAPLAIFADDLRRWLRGDAIRARPVGRVEKVWRWGKRNRALASLASLLLLAMAVGTGISSFFAIRADRTASRLAIEKDRADRTASRLAVEKVRADERHEMARRNLYINRMNLAQVAWENADLFRVHEILGTYYDRLKAVREGTEHPDWSYRHLDRQAANEDLRGWEWYYQQRLCHTELRRLKAHARNIAFNPTGEQIATAGSGGEVELWEVATGEKISTVSQPGCSVAYSQDGRLLAVGGEKGDIWIFDSSGERQLAVLKAHTDRVDYISFSPDSRLAISGSADNSIRLWDVEAAAEQNRFPDKDEDGGVHGVAWSPSGTQVGVLYDKLAVVWDVAPFKEAFRVPRRFNPNPKSISFSPDGTRIAVGSYVEKMSSAGEVWDLRSRSKICTGPKHVRLSLDALAFAPDGEHVISGGIDGTLRIWDARTGEETGILRGHEGELENVTYSPDGNLIASTDGGEVRLWDAQTDSDQEYLALHDSITLDTTSLAFSPDGRRLATGATYGSLRIWDLETRQPVELADGGEDEDSVRTVSYSSDGKYLATVSGAGVIKLLRAESGELATLLKLPRAGVARSVAFRPNRGQLAIAQTDGLIRIWDIAADRSLREFRAHAGEILSLAFSADGSQLASGGADGYAKLWDPEQGAELLSIPVSKPESSAIGDDGVNVITFSPDGQTVFTACHEAQMWDSKTGKLLRTFRSNRGVTGLAITADGNRLATCHVLQVKLWDILTGEEVRSLDAGEGVEAAVAFSPDGFVLAAGSFGEVRLWDARPMTPEIAVERAAHSVVNFTYEKLVLNNDVMESLRTNRTISEKVRQKALQFAAARSSVGEKPWWMLANAAWSIAVLPRQAPASYERALRLAIRALEIRPDDTAIQNTLGVAQYRVGLYEQALSTLLKCDEINKGIPANLAFIAMAQWQLDKRDEARQTLERLRESVKVQVEGSDEDRGFLREAEELIAGNVSKDDGEQE